MRIILLTLSIAFSFTLSAQYTLLQENFNDTIMPVGWSTNAVSGTATWSFGIDGSVTNAGNNNLDGTPMAYFDDDALGSGQTNNRAQLISPTFSNTGIQKTVLEFDYNFRDYGGPLDSFYVEVFNGVNWVNVFSKDSSDCGGWLGNCAGNFPRAYVDISSFANTNCQVRFTYFDGNDWCWYVGIDNVEIRYTLPFDMGVAEQLSPTSKCRLTASETLAVNLINYGTDTIKNFAIIANINSGNEVLNDTVNQFVAPLDTIAYTFDSTINLSATGIYNIMVYTIVNGDSATVNDTMFVKIENEPIFMPPYFHDFESTSTWKSGGINSSWQLGTPSGIVIDSAYSGMASYVTNLNGGHNFNELSYLYSPCYDIGQIQGYAEVSFKLNHQTLINIADLVFEVSTDNGTSWNRIESELGSKNWYDSSSSWEGNSSGWIDVRNTLVSLDSIVNARFRFRFQSIFGSAREGFAIDDFSIRPTGLIGLSLNKIINPTSNSLNSCSSGNENIVVSVRNEGTNTLDSVFFFYQVNGGAVFMDTVVRNVNSQDTAIYRLTPKYNFSAIGQYDISVWAKVRGDNYSQNDSIMNIIIDKGRNPNFGNSTIIESFDLFVDGSCQNSTTSNQGDSLINGWLEQSSGAFAWHVQNGANCNGTGSNSTGPSVDHTTGFGNFLYTEASLTSGIQITDALLESPCVDFTGKNSAGMKFWYHRFGQSVGNLYIDVFANGIWNLDVDSLIGETQTSEIDPWKMKEVVFNQFSNQVLNVRFRAVYGGTFTGDMAIDDVEFFSPPEYDAELVNLEIRQSFCEQDSVKLLMVVSNNGVYQINPNQLTIKYQINNGVVVEDSNSFAIMVDSSLSFVVDFANIFRFANQRIKAWVELPNDSNSFNDTLFYDINLPSRSPEYIEGFENIVPSNGFCGNYNTPLNLAWETDLNDQWVAGHDTICSYGARGATPTVSTGPDSAYAGNGFMYFEPGFNSVLDTAVLTSTCIDLRNDSISYLDFYYHMYGAGTGKLYIDVMANGVSTRLDSVVGQQHFSATDPWSLKMLNLNQFAGDIIRIKFTAIESTSAGISDQGNISIDNVRISNSFPVSVVEAENKNQTVQLFPNPTKGEFILRGNGYSTSELVLTVMDLNGRVIESRVLNPASSSINERFDLSNQANGVYLISIQSEGKVEVKKVVLSGK